MSAISHVINYDMPDTVDAYTHRIGRTGPRLAGPARPSPSSRARTRPWRTTSSATSALRWSTRPCPTSTTPSPLRGTRVFPEGTPPPAVEAARSCSTPCSSRRQTEEGRRPLPHAGLRTLMT
ncbi:MAG: hypothetical protein MZV70_04850 [Desulfobacterales bacterium]|nr:hypothetical protein [Desulfobacterales bacterium]